MIEFLTFLGKATLSTTCLFALFHIAFRKHTFFQANRILLNLLVPTSILLALCSLEVSAAQNPFAAVVGNISFEEGITTGSTAVDQEMGLYTTHWSLWVLLVYLVGVLVTAIRLLVSIRQMLNIYRASSITRDPDGPVLCRSKLVKSPYSFLNWVFFPESLSPTDEKMVWAHEKAHIERHHSVDVLLHECWQVLFWFNPVIYALGKAIKTTHEFQVDQHIIQHDTDLLTYLQSLGRVASQQYQHPLTHSFKQPSIKARIQMMRQHKMSKSKAYFYTLFLIPALGLTFAFANYNGGETPSISPVKSEKITSGFGPRVDPTTQSKRMHRGIDFRAPLGASVYATANGEVLQAELFGKWGNLVVIAHPNGFVTRYAHLQSFNVKVGEQVSQGKEIGKVGNTGLSLGPHLHYEIEKDGNLVNPEEYLPSSNKH